MSNVTQELALKGYKEKIVKGEQVWSKGDRVIVLIQNFGLFFSENEILLQGWTGDAILGESSLDGFMGWALKEKMKK